jgi:hypothetical protein
MASLTGDYGGAVLAIVGFVIAIGVFVLAALRNARWMYEHAALTATVAGPSRAALQAGDMMSAYTARARQGKFRVRRLGFMGNLRWRGPTAIVWRETIIGYRTSLTSVLMFLILALVYSLAPMLIPGGEAGRARMGLSSASLVVAIFVTWLAAWQFARMGFIDLLRRVDVDKALPFSLFRLLLAQSTIRNVGACVIGWTVAQVTLVLQPSLYQRVLAADLFLLPFAFVISGSVLIFFLLFPDIEDASQRSIRELLTMVAMAAALAPGLVFGGAVLWLVHGAWIPAAVMAGIVNCGVSALALLLASQLYATYNPSE